MVIDNTLHDSQPQARSADGTGAIATHKRLEQVLTLLGFNPWTIVFHLEPGAMRFTTATDFNPAVAVTRRVHHHIGQCALDRQRMHPYRDLVVEQCGINFPLIAAFCCDHFTEHGIEIDRLQRHLLTGTQIVNKLLDDGIALFNIFIDRFSKITILFAHHLRRQTNTRQRRAQVMANPGHQQRTVVGKLLHARGHMVKGSSHRTHL